MSEREWFYNAACDWYDGPPVIEIRDGQEYLLRIPHRTYYNGTTNIPKVEKGRSCRARLSLSDVAHSVA